MKNWFFYLAFILVAVTAGCEITTYGSDTLGVVGAILTFTVCFQIYSTILHALDRRKHASELEELEETLAITQKKVDMLTKQLASKATDQNKKIVSQLVMLEHLMREQAQHIETAQSFPGAALLDPFENAGQSEILAAVRTALDHSRIDFLMQPAVCLPQRKVQAYECFCRLRTAEGNIIPPQKALDAAALAGLSGQIDTHLLFNAVHIARRIKIKHRSSTIFCNFSPMTLRDMKQLRPILEYLEGNHDIRDMIVFEMPLESFLSTSPALHAVLQHLKKLGFGLGIDHVTRLDVDFDNLAAMGVKYFKVPAGLLLERMAEAKAPVAAEDLKKLMARSEIQLIVEKVESEKQVLSLLDYGIEMAQGHLFGAAKPAREENAASAGNGAQTGLRQVI